MVGDTVMDLGCAKNAGVISVLVGWSMALPPEKVENDAPDYILRNAADMLPFLEELNK